MGILDVDKLLGQEPDPLAAAAVNLTQAAGQNPQEHIERRKLSNASGVPAALMDDPEVKERARRDAFARELYLKEHPATAGFAANPNNAPLITDDILNLKDFEDKTRTLADTASDIGLTALKGVIAMPQAFVGLADIPTGGRVGKALEHIGYKPGEAQDILGGLYSPAQKEANLKVAEAEGVIDTAVAAVQNPSVIGQTILESLPSMIGGAGLARGGMAGAAKLAPKLATALSPKLAAALGSLAGSAKVAAALGEGAISAGGAAEQIRGENEDGLLTLNQAAAALASGGTTAAFSLLGGKVAEKLGIADVDVLLTGKGAPAGTKKALGRRVLEGMAAEGILEELPQSATEQMWQNTATGKPLFQGVDQAIVLGAFAGMAMGGGSNIVTRTAKAEQENTALLDALTAAEASRLKAGLPESFAEFAQRAGDQHGLSAVHLQADKAVEVALGQGLTVEQIMPWLEQYGATAEALDTAIQTGGTIALDYGKVAAGFSNDPTLQALKEDFMVSPSSVSKAMAAEAEQAEEAHLEKLNDLFTKEQDLKIGQEDVQAWSDALLATPGLNGRVTAESLSLLTARANALTALTGKPAIEHLNRMLGPTGLTTMKLKDFRERYGSAGEEIGQPQDAPSAPEIGRGYSWEAKEGKREIVGPARGRPAGWWEIKTEGESGSQYIHADDLPGEIERDVKDAEEWRGIRKAEEAARSGGELQRKRYEDTHGFTDSLGDMQKGKVLKALNALVNYKGRPISRKALVETKLSEGWRVSDEGDAIESPDGEFWIPAKTLTKTALDYARYLSGKGFPSEALAQSDRPFDGPDIAATPLPEGATTIEVDGVERPALNSEGRAIHPTVEGVKNFWRWFGDSKVVDSEGRPLVVYHGSPTPEGITEFSPGGKQGSRLSGDAYGVASYFTSSPGEASIYAREDGAVFPVYVRGEILDVDSKLSEVQSDRVSQLASEVMLPSDKARFAIGREVRSFDDVRDARDFFDAQRKNWEAFGDGMDRAKPEARADGGEYQVEFTNFDADVRIETGEDAFTLFKAIGFDNIVAAGFDGLMFARDGGAKWVVMQRPETNVKSATGNRGTFDPAAPSILMQSAWHGSPHTFDKFSTSAIGTGEGAQAYGYGLYFSEGKEIAEYYKNALAGVVWDTKEGLMPEVALFEHMVAAIQSNHAIPYSSARQVANDISAGLTESKSLKKYLEEYQIPSGQSAPWYKSALEALSPLAPSQAKGRLYKVELAPEEDEYLLWDKPLSEQSEKVKAALEGLDVPQNMAAHFKKWLAVEYPSFSEDFYALSSAQRKAIVEDYARATGKASPVPFNLRDGDSYYQMLSTTKGSDKAASEYLHSLGIRGIKYLDGTSRADGKGNYNYVIFSDDDVAITEMFQAQTNDPLGVLAIMGDRNLVNLFEKADKSTFLHETAHIFLNDLKFVAETLGVQTTEWESAKTWLGIGEDGVITRAQHERFAEHFEVYLKNGEAPVPELRSAFRAFKRWLTAIYDNIKASRYGQRAGITISPEIANLFDHLLATDQEIRAAREQAALVALLDDEMLKELSASPEQVDEYRNLSTQADDAAREKRDIHKLKDREELRKGWRKQAEAESFDQPVYGFIQTISKLGGINKQSAIDAFGAETLPDHSTLWRTKGDDINVAIAEHGAEFGYQAPADFIEQLRNLKPRNVWVEQRIAQLETLHDNAQDTQEVIRSTAMRRMLDIESVMLSKKTAGAQAIPAAAIKVWAAKTIAGRTVKQISMGLAPLQAQSRRLRQMAILAVRDGRWEDALRFNEQARRTEGLISASMRASKEWTKTKARWKQIAKWTNDNKNVKLGTAFRDQINRLLDQYEIASREYDDAAPDLQSFVAMRATGNPLESDGVVLAEWLGVQTGSHVGLSWERLQDLDDALKFLYGNGREELEGQRTAKGEFVKEIAGSIANSMNSLKPKRELWSEATAAGRAARSVQQKYRKFMAHTGILSFICKRMDGYAKHGLAQQQNQEIINGMARENDLWTGFSAKLEPLITRLTKDGGKVFTDLKRPAAFVDHGVNLQWTKKRVVCACLNMGNASNLQRLRDGFALSDADLHALAGKLTAAEWQDIQAIWDTVNEMWPMIADVHERINHFRPKKIEPQRLRIGTADGQSVSLAGGYYPVGYDAGLLGNYDLARWSERDDILNSNENTLQVPVAKSGMTKARADKVSRPLSLSFDVLGKHLHDSLRYIALAEAVRDTDRIFNNKELRAAAYDTIGPDLYGMIRPTLLQVLRPNQTELGRYEWLRTKTSVFYMAWNTWTAVQNITGVFPAMFHAGVGNYVSGMAHVASEPYQAYKTMLEMSGYMRLRAGNMERDMQSQLKQLASGGLTWKEVEEKFADAGFLGIRAIDTLVSLPAWWGVYNDQMRQHGDAQSAIEAADTAISKALGSGLAIDQTGIGRSVWRLLEPFMSFASAQQEVLRTEKEALMQGKITAAEYLHACLMVWIFPSLASTFLSGLMMYGLIGAVGGGDDDDKRKKTVGDYFTDVISYRLMGLPFIRDAWSAYLQGAEHKQPITAARMPFTEFIKMGQQAFYRVGALDGDSEKSQKALAWTLAEMVSFSSGLPVTRVYDKWRKGQEDIENREGWWMNHLVPQERKK